MTSVFHRGTIHQPITGLVPRELWIKDGGQVREMNSYNNRAMEKNISRLSSGSSDENEEVSTREQSDQQQGNMCTIVAGSNSPQESSVNSSHDQKHLTTAGTNTSGYTPEWTEHVPLDGPGHEHGAHDVDSINTLSSSTSVHEVRSRKLLTPKDYEELLRHVVAASQRDNQDQIDRLQEKLQLNETEKKELQFEIGRQQFLEDKEKRRKALQSATSYGNKQSRSCTADGATFMSEEENLPGGAGPLQQSSSHPSRDNSGRNLSSGNSDDSGGDMAVNADCDGSSVQSEPSINEHTGFPDSSNDGFLSNDSCSSATSSSTESPASSVLIAQPLVDSNSSSCTSHDACDGSPSATLDHHSAADTSSDEEDSLESSLLLNEADAECVSGEVETAEACAARDGRIDSGPVISPDRARRSSILERTPALQQDALPNGDMPVGQNGSGACADVGKDSTVDQSVSNEWQRLGARPKDRPPMKRVAVEPSLVDPVPQEVAGPVAYGLAGAFLARHSQDESLYQGSAEQVLPDDSSSLRASYVDEPNKAKPYFGDCQVASRPDAHSGSWFIVGANTEANLEPHGAAAAAVPSANSGGSMLNRGSGTGAVESMDNSLIALEQPVGFIIESLEGETNPSSAYRQRLASVIARERETERVATMARSRWCCTCACGEQVAEDRTPICGHCYKQQYLGPASLSAHNECCYCLEDAFSGCQILPCSHMV